MKKPAVIFVIWLAVGAVVGFVLNQLALWVGVGVFIGAAEASLAHRRNSRIGGAAGAGITKR